MSRPLVNVAGNAAMIATLGAGLLLPTGESAAFNCVVVAGWLLFFDVLLFKSTMQRTTFADVALFVALTFAAGWATGKLLAHACR